MPTMILPNGTGETLGDSIVTDGSLYTAGVVWYVLSTIGTDAVSPAGKDKEKPLATLAQAQTNASSGDLIVLLNGHTETLTSTLSITKSVIIAGSGTTSGKPGVQMKSNSAASNCISLAADGAQIRNIYFPTNVQSNSGYRLQVTSAVDTAIIGCYFECGANDQGPGAQILSGATGCRIENCTFISTATTTTTRPVRGLYINGSLSDIRVKGCIFSDGTVGFSTAAFDASTSALTRCCFEELSFLLGADFLQHASTTGWVTITTATGGGRVSW